MGRFIIRLPCDGVDYYLEWSTVVDAPTTYGMTLEEFKEHYQEEYGKSGMRDLETRMGRVSETGTSAIGYNNVKEIIVGNRAGDGEKYLSLEKIVDKYIRNRPKE